MQNLQTKVKNYYETLGVALDASPEEIKMAFRRLARRYHPDVNPGSQTAEENFKKINEAYDTLSDINKRQQYDFQFFGVSQRTKYGNGKNSNNGRRERDFPPFSDFSNFVENLKQPNSNNKNDNKSSRFRSNKTDDYSNVNTKTTKTINPRPLPRDIEAKLTLPLEKAYQGGKERIRLEDGRSLEVDMPSGMYNGQKIRLKGQGINEGDLYLKISISPHHFFQIEGKDISCQIPLTPSEAVLGGAIEIPTIDGLVKMNVPPGVKSGQRLRLANKGYPNIRGERGDQLVLLQVVLPPEISKEERELYEKIRQLETFKPRANLLF